MAKKIFKTIDPSFIEPYFIKKKDCFFPDKKKKKIKEVKIKQISPSWAKKTCLAKYEIVFDDSSEKIVRGTAKKGSPKKDVWKIMNFLYQNLSKDKTLAVARPLDYLENINLLLYEEAPGIPLVFVLGGKNKKEKENKRSEN